MKWYKIAFIIIFLLVVIIIYNRKTFKEGFTQYKRLWSPELIRRFNIYQTTINNNVNQFNLEVLQQQATPEEAEHLIKTGYWPWNDSLKQQYIDHVWSSTIIKIDPQYALNYAMSLYNQKAATELLAWNSKEGEFLLYGATNKSGDIIKCSNELQSIIMKNDEPLSPENIPKEMPGFEFIRDSCDPCVAINNPVSNLCPFKLNIGGDDSISSPWKSLWNV
jgi:hypothetical protein